MKLDKFKEFVKTKHPEIEVLNTNSEIKQRDKIDFFVRNMVVAVLDMTTS